MGYAGCGVDSMYCEGRLGDWFGSVGALFFCFDWGSGYYASDFYAEAELARPLRQKPQRAEGEGESEGERESELD